MEPHAKATMPSKKTHSIALIVEKPLAAGGLKEAAVCCTRFNHYARGSGGVRERLCEREKARYATNTPLRSHSADF